MLTIISTILLLNIAVPQYIAKYEMSLIVGGHVGFDVSSEKITFGMVPKGGTSKRQINIENREFYNKVVIRAYGGLAGWVRVSNNSFVMLPYEKKKLDVIAAVPENAQFGNYSGVLKIKFIKQD